MKKKTPNHPNRKIKTKTEKSQQTPSLKQKPPQTFTFQHTGNLNLKAIPPSLSWLRCQHLRIPELPPSGRSSSRCCLCQQNQPQKFPRVLLNLSYLFPPSNQPSRALSRLTVWDKIKEGTPVSTTKKLAIQLTLERFAPIQTKGHRMPLKGWEGASAHHCSSLQHWNYSLGTSFILSLSPNDSCRAKEVYSTKALLETSLLHSLGNTVLFSPEVRNTFYSRNTAWYCSMGLRA